MYRFKDSIGRWSCRESGHKKLNQRQQTHLFEIVIGGTLVGHRSDGRAQRFSKQIDGSAVAAGHQSGTEIDDVVDGEAGGQLDGRTAGLVGAAVGIEIQVAHRLRRAPAAQREVGHAVAVDDVDQRGVRRVQPHERRHPLEVRAGRIHPWQFSVQQSAFHFLLFVLQHPTPWSNSSVAVLQLSIQPRKTLFLLFTDAVLHIVDQLYHLFVKSVSHELYFDFVSFRFGFN